MDWPITSQIVRDGEQLKKPLASVILPRQDGSPFVQRRVVMMSIFGSHLYGTAGPDSDLDCKVIYMASPTETLHGDPGTRSREIHQPGSDRPTLDLECIELRSFITDALQGQTYALEVLCTPPSHRMVTTDIWSDILSQRDRLVSQKVKPFIGYCHSQAQAYAQKRDRLSYLDSLLACLERLEDDHDGEGTLRVGEVVDQLQAVSPERLSIDDSGSCHVFDRTFHDDAPVSMMYDAMASLRDDYGDRIKSAVDDQDWKSVYHAYRVAYELREWLEAGALTLPFPEGSERRQTLRRIKQGEADWHDVTERLDGLVEWAQDVDSDLPSEPDYLFWTAWLTDVYHIVQTKNGSQGGWYTGPYFDGVDQLHHACEQWEPGQDTLLGYIVRDATGRFSVQAVERVFDRHFENWDDVCPEVGRRYDRLGGLLHQFRLDLFRTFCGRSPLDGGSEGGIDLQGEWQQSIVSSIQSLAASRDDWLADQPAF